MQTAGVQAKKDMVKLARYASTSDAEAADPNRAYAASREQVQTNNRGRPRVVGTVSCTPDRAQHELLKNRHGADQRDPALQAKRKALQNYSTVPTPGTVGDFYRLSHEPLQGNASTQVLTEKARKSLQRWQLHGPERDPEGAGHVMRSLRSLSTAVSSLPTYADLTSSQTPGAQRRRDALFEYSKVAPKGARSLVNRDPPPRMLSFSSSAPAIHRPYIEPGEIDRIKEPGGFVVALHDHPPIQRLKNRERAIKSKISLSGGKCDFSTTADAMSRQLPLC